MGLQQVLHEVVPASRVGLLLPTHRRWRFVPAVCCKSTRRMLTARFVAHVGRAHVVISVATRKQSVDIWLLYCFQFDMVFLFVTLSIVQCAVLIPIVGCPPAIAMLPWHNHAPLTCYHRPGGACRMYIMAQTLPWRRMRPWRRSRQGRPRCGPTPS